MGRHKKVKPATGLPTFDAPAPVTDQDMEGVAAAVADSPADEEQTYIPGTEPAAKEKRGRRSKVEMASMGAISLLAGAWISVGVKGPSPETEKTFTECMEIFATALLAKYSADFEYMEETGFCASVAGLLYSNYLGRKRNGAPAGVDPSARDTGNGQDVPRVPGVMAAGAGPDVGSPRAAVSVPLAGH